MAHEVTTRRVLYEIPGMHSLTGLNASLDRFVGLALAANHPIWMVNHQDAPHSFDLFHDSPATRRIVRAALEFLGHQLHT